MLENPAGGEGCVTRIYGYDLETNRRSLTTRPPGPEGACATEGGTIEKHAYDEANRLADEGVAYDAFGDIETLPASDAGGAVLQSSFYADGQLALQTQAGETIESKLDPEGRVRKTIDSGNSSATIINHYAAPGEGPSWTEEPVSGQWTRNIEGIAGLAAIQEEGSEPVLQLEDLQGNIVATASLGSSAEALLSTEQQTEYGTPTTSKPKRYGWLGGDLLPRQELPSQPIAMGARSYIPEIGRFLQTDPQPGGSVNAYAYTYGNPVNESDPTGEFTYGGSEKAYEAAEELAGQVAAEALAREETELLEASIKAAGCPSASECSEPEEGGAKGYDSLLGRGFGVAADMLGVSFHKTPSECEVTVGHCQGRHHRKGGKGKARRHHHKHCSEPHGPIAGVSALCDNREGSPEEDPSLPEPDNSPGEPTPSPGWDPEPVPGFA